MKQSTMAILLTLAICPTLLLPARADGLKSAIGKLPKRLFVITVGTAVGTPVALVRCTRREVVNKTKEAYDLGGVPKPLGYLSAGFFGIPSGILSGAVVGTADGVLDSVSNSKDLDRSAISLEKLAF